MFKKIKNCKEFTLGQCAFHGSFFIVSYCLFAIPAIMTMVKVSETGEHSFSCDKHTIITFLVVILFLVLFQMLLNYLKNKTNKNPTVLDEILKYITSHFKFSEHNTRVSLFVPESTKKGKKYFKLESRSGTPKKIKHEHIIPEDESQMKNIMDYTWLSGKDFYAKNIPKADNYNADSYTEEVKRINSHLKLSDEEINQILYKNEHYIAHAYCMRVNNVDIFEHVIIVIDSTDTNLDFPKLDKLRENIRHYSNFVEIILKDKNKKQLPPKK